VAETQRVLDRQDGPTVLAGHSFSGMIVTEAGDSMFRRLTRGREQLHGSLNADIFESVCRQYFDIVRSVALPGTSRRLYCCRKNKG